MKISQKHEKVITRIIIVTLILLLFWPSETSGREFAVVSDTTPTTLGQLIGQGLNIISRASASLFIDQESQNVPLFRKVTSLILLSYQELKNALLNIIPSALPIVVAFLIVPCHSFFIVLFAFSGQFHMAIDSTLIPLYLYDNN